MGISHESSSLSGRTKNKEKMKTDKTYNQIVFILFSLYFFFLSTFQFTTQHWSAILDQDIYIIYNSLLLASGHHQEYLDHPAFTTFLFLGFIFKIFSFFFDNFTIQEILLSESIDKDLQNLFYVARIVNCIYFGLFIYFLQKIFNYLKIKIEISILSLISILFLIGLYESLFLIRSEILSILLSTIAFYYLIKFINKKSQLINCWLSGLFICLSMLAKIQVIFIIFIFFLLIPYLFKYFDNNNENFTILNLKYYYVALSFNLIFFLGYIVYQIFFAPRILNSIVFKYISLPHYIDLILFIFFYFNFLYLFSRKKFINFYTLFSTIFNILLGFIFCILILLFFDFLNLLKFNKTNIIILLNPIHFMSQYASNLYDPYLLNEYNYKGTITNFYLLVKDSFHMLDRVYETKYHINLGEKKIDVVDLYVFKHIIISSILTLIFIFINKNSNLLNILFLFLVGLSFITFSFTLRYGLRYEIYIYPLFLIFLSLVLNEFKTKLLYFSFLFMILLFSFEIFLFKDKFKKTFNRKDNIRNLCNIDINEVIEEGKFSRISLVDSYLSERFYKFDKRFVLNYCNQMKINLGWKKYQFYIE